MCKPSKKNGRKTYAKFALKRVKLGKYWLKLLESYVLSKFMREARYLIASRWEELLRLSIICINVVITKNVHVFLYIYWIRLTDDSETNHIIMFQSYYECFTQ